MNTPREQDDRRERNHHGDRPERRELNRPGWRDRDRDRRHGSRARADRSEPENSCQPRADDAGTDALRAVEFERALRQFADQQQARAVQGREHEPLIVSQEEQRPQQRHRALDGRGRRREESCRQQQDGEPGPVPRQRCAGARVRGHEGAHRELDGDRWQCNH